MTKDHLRSIGKERCRFHTEEKDRKQQKNTDDAGVFGVYTQLFPIYASYVGCGVFRFEPCAKQETGWRKRNKAFISDSQTNIPNLAI